MLANGSASQLEAARAALHTRTTVCIIGEAESGKTVSSSLPKHAIFNHFVPYHNDDYEAVVSQGKDSIDRSLADMFLHGRFPAAPPPCSDSRAVVTVYKLSGRGSGKFEIILHDPSGEDFFNYLTRECNNPDDRLREVLQHSSGPGEVGPLASYIFATMYVLVVDCSDVDALERKQSLLASAVTTLHKLRAAAGRARNGDVATPIAILFTKADLLDGPASSYTAGRLLDRMPDLKSALAASHWDSLDCFKVSVSTRAETGQNRAERPQREVPRPAATHDEAAERHSGREGGATFGRTHDDAGLAESLGGADARARVPGREGPHAGAAPKTSPSDGPADEGNRAAQARHLETPLAYAHDEYFRLIMWIISRLPAIL